MPQAPATPRPGPGARDLEPGWLCATCTLLLSRDSTNGVGAPTRPRRSRRGAVQTMDSRGESTGADGSQGVSSSDRSMLHPDPSGHTGSFRAIECWGTTKEKV